MMQIKKYTNESLKDKYINLTRIAPSCNGRVVAAESSLPSPEALLSSAERRVQTTYFSCC